jgi:N-acetylgalactosamine-6-sulfatase
MYKTLLVTTLAVWSFSLNSLAVERPPNIIFIFADDWGYGDLSGHGSDFVKTPNIDRMANEGIDFRNFTVNHPVCSPSRAAVMTGQFPARHSIHAHFSTVAQHRRNGMPDWLDPEAPMLPRMLQPRGYATGHFGKWHLTNRDVADAPLPTAYGYDEYAAFNLPGPQVNTAECSREAADFIRRYKDTPFFINLWLHETHLPHYPQEEFLKQFEHLDEQHQVYAAVVAEADEGVGLILDTLKRLGLDEKTLVIFSSDNGPESTGKASQKQHGDASTGAGLGKYYSVGTTGGLKGRKRSLFAGGVRVPFIARWPGVIPAGKIDTQSVITAVDLLPTFLEIAGQALPESYQPDGQSILSALTGRPFERSKPIFWEWKGRHAQAYLWPHLGIRLGKWKLMVDEDLDQTVLYDIDSDWAEEQDLSAQFPEIATTLLEQVIDWHETLPLNPPRDCFSSSREPVATKTN